MDHAPRILRIRKDDCVVAAFPAGESLYIEGAVSRLIASLAEESSHGRTTELVFAEDSLVVLEGLELIGCPHTAVHVWQAAALLYARKDRRIEEGVRIDFHARPNYNRHRRAACQLDSPPTFIVEDGLEHALLYPDEELIVAGSRGDHAIEGWLMHREPDPLNPGDAIAYTTSSRGSVAPPSGEVARTGIRIAVSDAA